MTHATVDALLVIGFGFAFLACLRLWRERRDNRRTIKYLREMRMQHHQEVGLLRRENDKLKDERDARQTMHALRVDAIYRHFAAMGGGCIQVGRN